MSGRNCGSSRLKRIDFSMLVRRSVRTCEGPTEEDQQFSVPLSHSPTIHREIRHVARRDAAQISPAGLSSRNVVHDAGIFGPRTMAGRGRGFPRALSQRYLKRARGRLNKYRSSRGRGAARRRKYYFHIRRAFRGRDAQLAEGRQYGRRNPITSALCARPAAIPGDFSRRMQRPRERCIVTERRSRRPLLRDRVTRIPDFPI